MVTYLFFFNYAQLLYLLPAIKMNRCENNREKAKDKQLAAGGRLPAA